MKRPIAALLSLVVTLVGQSAGATNHYVYTFSQFNALKHCGHDSLVSFDIARAYAERDQSIDEADRGSTQSAHPSEKILARGGPLHLYRSSAGKTTNETAPPQNGRTRFR
jgi:hypothetical protein